jgi:hypothetical protein
MLVQKQTLMVITGLYRLSHAALIIFRYLFVAEHGANTVIDRADLAGEDRKTIITAVAKVPDIVVDTEEERIYWIDIGRNSLETAKYDGTDRRLIRRSTNIYILMSGLTLYKVMYHFSLIENKTGVQNSYHLCRIGVNVVFTGMSRRKITLQALLF